MCEVLVQHGAVVNVEDDDKRTPLFYAVQQVATKTNEANTRVLMSSLAGACGNRGAADAARRRSKLQVLGFHWQSLRLENGRHTALVGTGMV